ncbi:MAG: MFS transporter [Ardenticatenaceae bacterium]|nr:MFS transporter [Ardenticatenaceae bacterium]HBY92620.1 MFS transporter [Chloroflexota bacterium]
MRMPWRKTFLLGLGFFGISLLWPLYDSYVPIFLRAFGLSNVVVGFLMTLDNYANLFIQPWVGQRSDRTRTRWGRRYPYILLGAPIAAVGGMLIPLAARHALPLLVGAMVVMNVAMALFRSPTVALLGDVFPSALRSRANGVINFMGLLAGVIAFLGGGALYRMNPAYPFWAAALMMLGVLSLLIAFVRERAQLRPEATPPSAGPQPGVVATLRALVANPDRSALLILSALLAWSIGFTAIQAFFTLYGKQELGLNESTASQLLSFYPLAGLIFAIPGGYLGTYLGRRRTMLLCLMVLGGLLIAFLFISPTALSEAQTFNLLTPATWFASPTIRLLILMLMGAGAALTVITVNVLPMLFDAVPGGQIGSYTGLYYLFGSLASIMGPPLGGLAVDLTGSYRTIFVFAPLFVFTGLLLMWRVRGGEARPAAAEIPALA